MATETTARGPLNNPAQSRSQGVGFGRPLCPRRLAGFALPYCGLEEALNGFSSALGRIEKVFSPILNKFDLGLFCFCLCAAFSDRANKNFPHAHLESCCEFAAPLFRCWWYKKKECSASFRFFLVWGKHTTEQCLDFAFVPFYFYLFFLSYT